MQISIIVVGIIVLSYLCIKGLEKRNRFSRIESVKAISTLLNITMQVDQSVTEEEIKKVSNCLYDLIKRSGPDGPFSEYWSKKEGEDFLDAEVVSSMCTASEAYVSEIGLQHSETEMDSQVYTEFDSLTDLIIKDHREYAFQSLVALCGADSELHPNELKVLNYLSEKLKIENKDKIIAEERNRIE